MDGGEIVVHVGDDFFKRGVFATREEFATERHEERDLELDLVGVGAVENAVQFGVVEGSVEAIGEFGFFCSGGFFGGERIFVGRITLQVGGELVGGAG